MGLVRFVLSIVIFWIIAFILVLTLGITLSIWGIQLNELVQNALLLLITSSGAAKFGIKKEIKKNKYNNFPNY